MHHLANTQNSSARNHDDSIVTIINIINIIHYAFPVGISSAVAISISKSVKLCRSRMQKSENAITKKRSASQGMVRGLGGQTESVTVAHHG